MSNLLPRKGCVVIESRKVSEVRGILLPEDTDQERLYIQRVHEDSDLAPGLEVLLGPNIQGIHSPEDNDVMVIAEDNIWAVVAPEAQA